jgi:hypothetical protein
MFAVSSLQGTLIGGAYSASNNWRHRSAVAGRILK